MLHVCCAPCASVVLERLSDYFDITAYYCNPNIYPRSEYDLRAEQLPKLIKGLGLNVKLECGEYAPEKFARNIGTMAALPEGGLRCEICFKMRLGAAASLAKVGDFDYFSTTLSVGPMKNVKLINNVLEELSEEYGIAYLPSDFRKKDGYKRSVELSKMLGLYRQNYCGCEFSIR